MGEIMDADDPKNGVAENEKKGEEVMIEEETFVLRVYYHEGHILTTGEAKALKQSRYERLRRATHEFKKQTDDLTSNIASNNQLAEVFESPMAYRKGHPLTADDAKECNELRRENIREYAEKLIRKATDPEDSMTMEVARKAIMDHDETYELRAKPNLVEVEKKAKEFARSLITDQLKREGLKIKDIDEDELNKHIDNMTKDAFVVEEAERRVAVSDAFFEEFDLKSILKE